MTGGNSRRQAFEHSGNKTSQPGDEHLWALDFPAWQEVRGRLSVADHQYKPDGHDQMQLCVGSFEDVREVLLSPIHAGSMRLMRRNPTRFGRFHSLDLAGAATQEFNSRLGEISAAAQAGDY